MPIVYDRRALPIQPASTTVTSNKAYFDVFKAAFGANPSWVKVSETDVASSYVTVQYKIPLAVSGLPTDLYLTAIMHYSTAVTPVPVNFTVHDRPNISTSMLDGLPVCNGTAASGALGVGAGGQAQGNGWSHTGNDYWAPPTNNTHGLWKNYHMNNTTTGGGKLHTILYDDGIAQFTESALGYGQGSHGFAWYAGKYATDLGALDPSPLVATLFRSVNQLQGDAGTMRHPGADAAANGSAGAADTFSVIEPWTVASASRSNSNYKLHTPGADLLHRPWSGTHDLYDTVTPDAVNLPKLVEPPLINSAWGSGNGGRLGIKRGRYHRIRVGVSNANIFVGDMVISDGRQWIKAVNSTSGDVYFDFGPVAA